ncbi:uncharacterized protein LOC129957477 [Argiope bruennichi]|uniref:Uncharacterized protein n=1 Tax=Argiope bruennichi TaxID=94029 RepID=A0A8T0FBD9_ARGBR|nr:uncharacterized protein LOC129957477 [Argiope bruennichi]XP_055925776.1 uncharacterized protein LOC129957477 [Argiope bruennichi]KAF8788577.1 hypothetical protein HNY73_006605 [Argiope bruennichi]
MGRQGPKLVPFLHDGVVNRKYRNLISEDASGLKFSIVLPHKTKKLDTEDELIFKDWYALNGKKYIFASKHYTDAKQAMTASLRKSDYVEKVHCTDYKLTYRILNKAEVKEKKRLKKELKKKNELKKETLDSDAALSSEESGYGSGTDSPLNNYPVGDNLTASSGEESLQASFTMAVDSLFGINSLESTCADDLNGFLKSEPMDVSIPVADSHAVPDYLVNIQPFVNNLQSTDCFPESSPSLDLMECFPDASELNNSGFTEELPIENGYDFLQLNNLSYEDLNNVLLKDFPAFNFNSPLVCEDYINEQASELQNMEKLLTEPEDLLTEELFDKLMEDISTANSHPSVAYEDNNQENRMPSDADLHDQKTEANENVYYCKKCIHLGKIPILLCEPQFENGPSEAKGEIKIAFEERILKEINGFKCVKEYKFINDHLMVILEPNDD